MNRLRPDVDIVRDILDAVLLEQPGSKFVNSLLHQYLERGGLSKRQLQGLYDIALKAGNVAPAKMATLEAIILRKKEKTKSELPENIPLFQKDEKAGELIRSILAKFPQHKRVLFLQAKYENNEPLSSAEMSELEKFSKLLT